MQQGSWAFASIYDDAVLAGRPVLENPRGSLTRFPVHRYGKGRDRIMESKNKQGTASLTVEQVASKLGKRPETIRRMLRTGKLTGEKIGGKGEWRVPTSSLTAEPPALSQHELRHMRDWAVFPKGLPDRLVREMLRHGYFRKAIVLYELDRAEAAARQILAEAKNKSRAVDASLIAEAKRILSMRQR
jgi:excisionase family DNA binding protein